MLGADLSLGGGDAGVVGDVEWEYLDRGGDVKMSETGEGLDAVVEGAGAEEIVIGW